MSSIPTSPAQAKEIVLNDNSNGEREELMGDSHLGSAKKRATNSTKFDKVPTSPGGNSPAGRKKKKVRRRKADSNVAVTIKYVALFLLVAQMVGLVLLMRYSRTTARSDPNQPLYLASTAVFFMEAMKLVLCLLVLMVQNGVTGLIELLRTDILGSPMEILKLCVPSLLYTAQNNLLYLALTNLDAATYQVCYQLKILTTALFSAILLQRRFSATKWMALVVLTVGVAIVQLSGSGDQHNHPEDHHEQVHKAAAGETDATADDAVNNRFLGLVAVLCAACTSGFAGVYFEKILKGSRTSLWVRNIQMGLPSVFVAFVTVYAKDGAAVQKNGFLGGYSNLVWLVITVQAVGGLIVATVVKYADNVLKVFATSFSIVVSCIISAFLFDFHPTQSFLVGASLVVTATVMYSSPEKKPKRKSILPR